MRCLVFGPRGFRGLLLDLPAAAPGTAQLRQVCLLWAGRGEALCNRRGWARCWETEGCCQGGDRNPPGSIPRDIPGDAASRRDGGGAAGCWRRVHLAGGEAEAPCPRRVPQPRAGTSDSSGGRGKGRAREDEPVQASAHLVSPPRLRCLIPSCRSAPVLPALPRHRLSHARLIPGTQGPAGCVPFPPGPCL